MGKRRGSRSRSRSRGRGRSRSPSPSYKRRRHHKHKSRKKDKKHRKRKSSTVDSRPPVAVAAPAAVAAVLPVPQSADMAAKSAAAAAAVAASIAKVEKEKEKDKQEKIRQRKEKLRLWQLRRQQQAEAKAKVVAGTTGVPMQGATPAANGTTAAKVAPPLKSSGFKLTSTKPNTTKPAAMKMKIGFKMKQSSTSTAFGMGATKSAPARPAPSLFMKSEKGSRLAADPAAQMKSEDAAFAMPPPAALDPLEAFMRGISKKTVSQKAFDEAPDEAKDEQHVGNNQQLVPIKTVSLDDILGGKMQSDDVKREPGADGATAEADDDQYYREFQEKMKAMKEAEAAQRIEDEKKAERDKSLGIMEAMDNDVADRFKHLKGSKSALEMLKDKMKKKELKKVDHKTQDYIPFRKKFYRPHPEIQRITKEKVAAKRKSLGVKIRGKACPNPIDKWEHSGLSTKILYTLHRKGYTAPFPIQKQAIPAIMSGRDVLAVAKTGSGKTLGFVLPMLRQILDQPRLAEGEGPIGLICAPARELAVQIHLEVKSFARVLGMRATAVYGGAPVADQIADLKRGADVVTCTPGRLIDLLCMNAGRLISLRRVTYLVLDEADRMFDMGFEPQIAMILQNLRPDRQTVMFSATFPAHVERLARKLLKFRPLEIMIGGRSKVSDTVEQHIEVRNDEQKWPRLLQLLGLHCDKGSILVFVDTQQRCDAIFTRLMRAGYYVLSLHGGKDQADRDQTISDFKSGLRTVMVATSVAGRGLDVKDLVLVVNYSCPNHLEDYVHRVGRTGRAGKKGIAYTFIQPDEEQYSPDMIKALKQSDFDVPQELTVMHMMFMSKVKAGKAKKHSSGYSGKGFKFDEEEDTEKVVEKEVVKLRTEVAQGTRDMNELIEMQDELRKIKKIKDTAKEAVVKKRALPTDPAERAKVLAQEMAAAIMPNAQSKPVSMEEMMANIKTLNEQAGNLKDMTPEQRIAAAKQNAKMYAMALSYKHRTDKHQGSVHGAGARPATEHYVDKVEINEYPQKARYKITHKAVLSPISDFTGAAITCKGMFVPAGRKPLDGMEKLHLVIEGSTPIIVKKARAECLRILNEITMECNFDRGAMNGKYSVV